MDENWYFLQTSHVDSKAEVNISACTAVKVQLSRNFNFWVNIKILKALRYVSVGKWNTKIQRQKRLQRQISTISW